MKRILIVEEEQQDLRILLELLGKEGYALQSAVDLDVALHRLRAWKPDLIFLSLDLPRLTDWSLIQKIRVLTQGKYVALILATQRASMEMIQKGFASGADDILFKPFQSLDVVRSVYSMMKIKDVQDTLKRAHHRIEELTSEDELTGMLNMKAAYRRGEEEIARSRKLRKPISCLLINIDHFVSVNQNHGFIAGCQILQEVARRIQQCLRSTDIVARVGADEFMVLLKESDLSAAQTVAEKVRDEIQLMPFKREKEIIKLTVTVGVASLTPEQSNQKMADLFHVAGEALRSAKANGANRVEVYLFN